MSTLGPFSEIADRVYVLVEPLIRVNATLVVGDGHALVVDTLSTGEQARELREAIRRIAPVALTVVNTHHHFDHSFGNSTFASAAGPGAASADPGVTEVWAQEAAARLLADVGEEMRQEACEEYPDLAEDIQRVRIRTPDRTVHRSSTLDIGGRRVDLVHLGRGHSEGDLVVEVPEAGVLLAGDLVEEGSAPSFGDAYPLSWPDTLGALRDRLTPETVVVPGHGALVGYDFVRAQHDELTAVAWLIREAHGDDGDPEKVARSMPLCRWGDYGLAQARFAVARGYRELDVR
jgi:glyoxylase-like metal-dependent hydrolase (beta-lactamase superfamily II)